MTPVRAVLFRLGILGDERRIQKLWRKGGEGAVDIRALSAIRKAIRGNQVVVVEAEGQIVGTASYFLRDHGLGIQSVEMGGLTIDEDFRHFGLAQLLAICRLILILPSFDKIPILSEVYASSMKSLRYLLRLGFQPLDRVPFALHETAWIANKGKAVIYMVADPMNYRTLCLKFAGILREGLTHGPAGSIKVDFHSEFETLSKHIHFAQKSKYAGDAFGNRDGIGFGRGVMRWLARHFGTACITRTEFLAEKGELPGSWGYCEGELNDLGLEFLRSLKGAATS